LALPSVLVLLLVAFDLRTSLPEVKPKDLTKDTEKGAQEFFAKRQQGLPQVRQPSPVANGDAVMRESGLTASRRISETRPLMGDPVLVELTLSNSGRRIEKVLIKDTLPVHANVTKGSTSLLCGLNEGGMATLRYEVQFDEPGEHQFGSCSVRLESMFGLTERVLVLPAPLSARVYPRHLVKNVAIGPARAFGWSGVAPSRYKGGRLEFMNIRGYVPGDPLKDVNWRASGRLGKTLVNEWNVERGLDCVIIVDLSSVGLPKVGEWSGKSGVVTSAYELASSLVSAGNRVGLLVMGSYLGRIRPGFGSRQLRTMVEMLVDSREGSVWSMRYVEHFLELFFSRQYTMREGTLFFVFAWPSSELLESVTSLSRKGFVCNSVLVDVLEGEGRALEKSKMLKPKEVEFGSRFARAEADSLKATLGAVSDVYVWTAYGGFKEATRRPRR